MMNNHVGWTFELEVQEGKDAAFRDLMREMVDNTIANEPETLIYEWQLSPDGRRCHLLERYADSAAAMVHSRTFQSRYAKRFFSVLTPVRCVVYGNASAELRTVMDGLQSEYLSLSAGFCR